MSRYFGDGFCGPGFTEVQMPSGDSYCLPDATTGPVNPPHLPPIDYGQGIPLPPLQPAPQGNNNPAAPVGVPLKPPAGPSFGSSQGGLLLLLAGGALLFLTMGKGGRR